MNPDLAFALEHFRGEVFASWLERLLSTTFGHGSALVIALGSPSGDRPGMSDNTYAADRLLAAAEAEGWIAKAGETPSPSAEQRFFGVGGMHGSNPNLGAYPSVWGWKPGARAADAREWLRDRRTGIFSAP